MQCASAILSSVACRALQYFSTLSHKQRDFRGWGGGVDFEYKMCTLIACRILRDIIMNIGWKSVQKLKLANGMPVYFEVGRSGVK